MGLASFILLHSEAQDPISTGFHPAYQPALMTIETIMVRLTTCHRYLVSHLGSIGYYPYFRAVGLPVTLKSSLEPVKHLSIYFSTSQPRGGFEVSPTINPAAQSGVGVARRNCAHAVSLTVFNFSIIRIII